MDDASVGAHICHWCQLKEVSSPELRTRVPSPLVGNGIKFRNE